MVIELTARCTAECGNEPASQTHDKGTCTSKILVTDGIKVSSASPSQYFSRCRARPAVQGGV
jgi:hypothetical protein